MILNLYIFELNSELGSIWSKLFLEPQALDLNIAYLLLQAYQQTSYLPKMQQPSSMILSLPLQTF